MILQKLDVKVRGILFFFKRMRTIWYSVVVAVNCYPRINNTFIYVVLHEQTMDQMFLIFYREAFKNIHFY